MTSSNPGTTALHADQEHAGIRAVVMLIVLGGFVIGFLIVHAILSSGDGLVASYAFPLSCVMALILALAAAALGESIMKRSWPSGRRLEIDDAGLSAWLPEDKTATLDWSGRVWAIKWTFSLAGYPRGGRERRLTGKYRCLACQLQQDDVRVIVYGYLKEQEAELLLANADFNTIDPSKFYDRGPLRRLRGSTDRPKLPTSVLTGKDGPIWLAEQRRWTNGIELTGDDFVTFWDLIGVRIEE